MSIPDERQTYDEQEILEERFGDRRHVLERIAELDGPLSDDAEQILERLDEGGDQS
jgi:hypothetical protein